jgi:ribulose-bisphosphate carboxylase large chain
VQKQYLDIGKSDIHSGEYVLAVFRIKTYNNISLTDAATEVAAESSTGSNLKVGTATDFSKKMDAKVYKVDEENNLAYISYPWHIFDRGGNIQNIITFLAGNVFGMSELSGCKLLDIYFPGEMLPHYDGPSTTLDDLRKYLKVYDRPILGTIIKPKIGLKSEEYAKICFNFWSGGGDFVKNDEPQADQYFAPFTHTVNAVAEAMEDAEDITGATKVHSFNVSAADLDTMLKRADFIIKTMQKGSYAFLIDGITAGWTAVQTLRRHFPEVFIHFHRAGHGAFTREENPFGFSVPVLTKFARLAGASGIHTGTAGVGKMAGSPDEDVTAAKLAIRLSAKGHFFDQVWTGSDIDDLSIQRFIKQEKKNWQMGPRALSNKRKQASTLEKLSDTEMPWKSIKKTCPIASGGLNPVLLPKFIETIGSIDFIVTMGGGVHSHPSGTKAGATAVIQAYEAWQQNIPLKKYATSHKELAEAIEFFNKHGTQAHKTMTK